MNTDKQFEHRMKCNMLAIALTRKQVEQDNLPEFHAIDILHTKERELRGMKSREFNQLYKLNGKPENLDLWGNWQYEPLKECVCFPGSKCDSIGECGR